MTLAFGGPATAARVASERVSLEAMPPTAVLQQAVTRVGPDASTVLFNGVVFALVSLALGFLVGVYRGRAAGDAADRGNPGTPGAAPGPDEPGRTTERDPDRSGEGSSDATGDDSARQPLNQFASPRADPDEGSADGPVGERADGEGRGEDATAGRDGATPDGERREPR
ncbi:hypothetical protein [Halosimplex marinum]|uniref:hypothetical protein n=1 Tax=Halosimplex marinum TaxID=3396620 RepID=UPI003F54B6AF